MAFFLFCHWLPRQGKGDANGGKGIAPDWLDAFTMVDVLTKEQRAYCMSRIRAKDTKPELTVRRLVHCMGYRFRLHRTDLPGTPDIVFPKLRKIIFIHGCYWHLHDCKYGRVVPKQNGEFWATKRQGNVARDQKNLAELEILGWDSLVLWECMLKDAEPLVTMLRQFLSGTSLSPAHSRIAVRSKSKVRANRSRQA